MFEGILCQVTEYDPAALESLSQGDCPWNLGLSIRTLFTLGDPSRATKDLGFHRDLLFRTLDPYLPNASRILENQLPIFLVHEMQCFC
jgi:hypothetical protein